MWNRCYLRNNNRSAYIAYKSGGVIFPIFFYFFYFLKVLRECKNAKRVQKRETVRKNPRGGKTQSKHPPGEKRKAK